MKSRTLNIDYSDLHWGKYDSPIAQYISIQVMGNGELGDDGDYESDDMGNGMARFGRRIQWWNDQGFVGCDVMASVESAREDFARMSREYYHAVCEKCGELVHNDEMSWYEHAKDECEPEPTPHVAGGLLDEIRQAEREIGTY